MQRISNQCGVTANSFYHNVRHLMHFWLTKKIALVIQERCSVMEVNRQIQLTKDLLHSNQLRVDIGTSDYFALDVLLNCLTGLSSGLPALGNITNLKNLDLSRRDYTVKVRVIRLWKQPMHNNPQQWYSIEMIVVDEEGTKMQANVLRRWFSRFEHVLNESDCYFIIRPTIGLNESKYKYVQNQTKLGLYCDTTVYRCNDFRGLIYGFSFTNFSPLVDQTVPENQTLDVIGFVADVGELKKLKTQKGKDTKKLNVTVQDHEMQTIYFTLWDSYADKLLEHWENRDQEGITVIILQFGTVKYFGKSAYVNNHWYDVSKPFINSDIDEISSYRNRLLLNLAGSSSSTQSSNVSGTYLSMYNEYVVRSEFNNIAEVNLHEVKSVVIVGTVRLIPKNVSWYYLACKTCNKKVTKKHTNDNQPGGDEEDIYECKTESCNNNVIQYLGRLRVPLAVQDSTGTISLTLFDRDASKLLKTTASTLIDKYVTNGDNVDTPTEFDALVGKKFAFKIDIAQWNIDNTSSVFGISKLTDDVDITFELEKKANNFEVDNSASLSIGFNDTQSQGTVDLMSVNSEDITMGLDNMHKHNTVNKAALESVNDNVTSMTTNVNDKSIGKTQVVEPSTFKRKSKNPDFKKNLLESYDVEMIGELSSTKPHSDGKPVLLIPKIEK